MRSLLISLVIFFLSPNVVASSFPPVSKSVQCVQGSEGLPKKGNSFAIFSFKNSFEEGTPVSVAYGKFNYDNLSLKGLRFQKDQFGNIISVSVDGIPMNVTFESTVVKENMGSIILEGSIYTPKDEAGGDDWIDLVNSNASRIWTAYDYCEEVEVSENLNKPISFAEIYRASCAQLETYIEPLDQIYAQGFKNNPNISQRLKDKKTAPELLRDLVDECYQADYQSTENAFSMLARDISNLINIHSIEHEVHLEITDLVRPIELEMRQLVDLLHDFHMKEVHARFSANMTDFQGAGLAGMLMYIERNRNND